MWLSHVTYWIYENWVAENKAVIHVGTCRHCNDGAGHGTNVRGNRNGRWSGPFATLEQAQAAAVRTGRPVRTDRCVAGGSAAWKPLRSINARSRRGTNPSTTPRDAQKRPVDTSSQPVTADDLGRWRRQLLRIFDELDGHRIPNAGPGSRLAALRDSNQIPRHIAALMKVILESRNAVEYEDRRPSLHEGNAARSAWSAIGEWAEQRRIRV